MSNTNSTSILAITAEQIQYESQQYEQAFNILRVLLNNMTCYMPTINIVVDCQFSKTPANGEVVVKRRSQSRAKTSGTPHNCMWQVVSSDEHIVYPDIPNIFNGLASTHQTSIQPRRAESAILDEKPRTLISDLN